MVTTHSPHALICFGHRDPEAHERYMTGLRHFVLGTILSEYVARAPQSVVITTVQFLAKLFEHLRGSSTFLKVCV